MSANFIAYIAAVYLALAVWPVVANESANSKSVVFDQILSPTFKKVKFRMNTFSNKDDVHLQFEAMKLSSGQYAVYKTGSCALKNFSPEKLMKLNSKDLFFTFKTNSGNIIEERKIDFRMASKFNLGIYSFVLVKSESQKTAIVCFSQ